MKLNNNIYNFLKYLDLIALPACGACYYALSQVWDLPYAGEITATVSAVVALIGALLGISTYNYNKEKNDVSDYDSRI